MEEIYPPKRQEFAYVTDGAGPEEEILQLELMILKGLNWGLSPMTPNAWMRLYMQIFHGSKKPFDESFCLPAYSGLPFSRAMQLLDLCVLDISSLEFSYSVLATSALYHSESEAVALHVSGYSWQQISKCVSWMSAFAFALRERSPLQPKSFHGVSPEDAHHLQPHVVDLELLGRAQDRLSAIASGGLRESPDPSTNLPPGLIDTPAEEDGDIMHHKGAKPSLAVPHHRQAVPLSPSSENDIW
jgi:cyclin E